MNVRSGARVVGAVARKDLQVALTQRLLVALGIVIPANFLLLFMIFALTGGQAPTAVVMEGRGPLAQRFLDEMRGAHSFIVLPMSARDAQDAISAGRVVAVVTIPADFDRRLQAGDQVELPVRVDNLQTDFTNDIRRAVPMTVTRFEAAAFPGRVSVHAEESDAYAQDTGYIAYLAVSVAVLGLLLAGILQGASSAAAEHESGTVIELALCPAPRWTIVLGKLLAALTLNAASGIVVLAIVIALEGSLPAHPWEALGFAALLMIAFASLGVLIGNLVRRRQVAIPLSIVLSLPLFFISGPFGPINWLGALPRLLATFSPAYYGIGAFQHAFHGYQASQVSLGVDVFVLAALAATAVLLAARTLRPVGSSS